MLFFIPKFTRNWDHRSVDRTGITCVCTATFLRAKSLLSVGIELTTVAITFTPLRTGPGRPQKLYYTQYSTATRCLEEVIPILLCGRPPFKTLRSPLSV